MTGRKTPWDWQKGDVAELRHLLIDISDHMDDYLPTPTIEAGTILAASGLLGEQQREIAALRAGVGDGTQLRMIQPRPGFFRRLLGRKRTDAQR